MTDILIADDHPLFRDALRRAVHAALANARVHDAANVHALFELIEQFGDADLLLLDLHMPGAHGFSALAHIRGQYPALPIIVVSAYEQARVVHRAIAHGAAGYVPKSADANDMVNAIRTVLDGEIWIPDGMLNVDVGLAPDETVAARRMASLTPQQFRILTMITAGLLNKQIADGLDISEATVKAHMTAIMRKLGVNNRTQAAVAAQALALDLEPGPLPALSDDAG